jgi:tetratricopeptide (TPR) repeat protein
MKNYLLGICVLISFFWGCKPEDTTKLAITNVNVIPMSSDTVLYHQTVTIKDGLINRIEPFNKQKKYGKYFHVNGEGLYLMPGIADLHTHPAEYYEPVSPLFLFLANGITTIRSCDGSTGNFILRWKEQVKNKERLGPRILAGGPFLYNYQNIDTIIKMQKNYGFDFIKTSSFMTKESFNQAMSTCSDINMYSVGHIPFSVGFEGVVEGGLNEIAHVEEIVFSKMYNYSYENDLLPLKYSEYYPFILKMMSDDMESNNDDIQKIIDSKKEIIKKIVADLTQKDVAVHTTLYVDEVIKLKKKNPQKLIQQESYKYIPESYKKQLLKGVDRNLRQSNGLEHLGDLKFKLDSLLFRELYKNDVALVFGTDVFPGMGMVTGYSIHGEFKMLTRYGLKPFEALELATRKASQIVSRMTGKDDFGTVETGKRADLILVGENPLEDIKSLKGIEGLILSGTWISKDSLNHLIEINEKNIPKPGRAVIVDSIKEQGIESGLELIWKSKNAIGNENRLIADERTLTYVGYDLLKENLIDEAIVIFKLLVDEYPFSSNAYDSLAEAYLKKGDKKRAKKYYLKVLEFNPRKTYVLDIIENME